MDLHAIAGNPVTLIGTVISLCAAIVGGIWKAFTNEVIVTGAQHRRIVAENERNQRMLFQSLGITETVLDTAHLMVKRQGQEVTDGPPT